MIDTVALREKVLDLAIRGKLVPQDPTDEPAAVLLERIRVQKQQMVKDGKLKPKDIKGDTVIFVGDDNLHYEKFSDGTVKCIEDEIPFDLPSGWIWCRLSQIIVLYSGQDLIPSRYNDEGRGIPYITGASNLENKRVIINRWTETPTTHATKGDLLLTCKGSGVGKMAWCDIDDAHIARQIMALRCIEGLLPDYLELVMSAMITSIKEKANGLIPGLSRDVILDILSPIPPASEQERIVQSVASLILLIDQADQSKAELLETIRCAKSRILDLAIRGQLIPQDPDDEPASVLLERIQAEKEELIRQGKIKRDKKESIIFRGEDNSYYLSMNGKTILVDDSSIFDLPDSWKWTTLPTIASIDLGKTLDRAKNTGKLYPYLRSVNVQWGSVDLTDVKEMRFEDSEIEKYTVTKHDLLICEGGDVGRCCVWTDEKDFLYQNALHRVRMYADLNPHFYQYVLMAYEAQGVLKRISTGVTIKHLTGNTLSQMPVPLPPIAEQQRIVERINSLFLCLDSMINCLN